MDNFDLRKFLAEGKLYENTEALSREEVIDMAQKIADEFSYEDAQEGGSSMVYMVGNVDGMRFELDTKATNRTPADDAKYGTGEGMGGNFRIDVKPNGYEIRNSEKGGLVAIMDMENGFRMLSAAESRAELEGEPDVDWKNDELDMKRMEEGEEEYNTDPNLQMYIDDEEWEKENAKMKEGEEEDTYFDSEGNEYPNITHPGAIGNTGTNIIDLTDMPMDEAKEEEMLDEGWKETLVGIGMAAASIAGIGKAMAPSPEALADKEQAELVVNAQQDALEKSSDEEVNQMVNSLEDAGIQIRGTYIKIPPSMYDKYRDNPQELDKIINQEQRKVLQKLMVKGNDMVKSGFVITSSGALQWANPSQITPINEEKENKPSNKMKKSELKEMIRQAMLAETSVKENALGMTDSRLSSDQHVELDYAVRGDSEYTFGNDPYADDQLRYKYAKKMGFLEETLREEEEDEDVEAEIEADVDVDVNADMDMDVEPETDGIDVKQDADAELSGTVGDVQDNLEAALEAARALGDEKLEDQIGNTLTFFTRTHVVK